MKHGIGAGLLGLALLGAPALVVFADDVEGEPLAAAEEEGSNRNLILAAIAAVVVIGGGVALSRRS